MIYINDKFIEMYAEMTKKFYDSINEENKKQKDMIEFINYLKELIERNHSLEKGKQELIEYLKEKKNELYKKLSDYNDLARIGKETDIEFFEALILERKIDVYEEILNKIEKR